MSTTTDGGKRMDFSRFPRRALPRDEVLFYEDDPSRELYVLLTGSLGVFRDDVQVAVVDRPLAIVGEISALTGRPRNATVRALQPSSLVVVEEPERLFEEYPQLGTKIARLLAERLGAMNARFVDLKTAVSRGRALAAGEAEEDECEQTAPVLAVPVPVAMLSTRPQPVVPAAGGEVAAVVSAAPAADLDATMAALSDLLDWDPGLDPLT